MHLIVYIQKIKAMSKVSKIHYRLYTDFNALNAMYVEDIEDGVCGFYATLHTEYYYSFCYSRQRCQILCTVLCIQGPSLLQERRLFEKLSILWIYWFTTSQSEEAALLTFFDLSTTRMIAGKTHS